VRPSWHSGLRVGALAATAIAVLAIAVSGCGGGDDSTTTATRASADAPTVTAPRIPQGSGDGTRTSPITPSNATVGAGAQRFQQRLAPFQDCLRSHGVDPTQFQQSFRQNFQSGQVQRADPAQMRKQIQAGIACIPELPPRIRQWAERLKARYEQRNG
jgi:hypothetical protein